MGKQEVGLGTSLYSVNQNVTLNLSSAWEVKLVAACCISSPIIAVILCLKNNLDFSLSLKNKQSNKVKASKARQSTTLETQSLGVSQLFHLRAVWF